MVDEPGLRCMPWCPLRRRGAVLRRAAPAQCGLRSALGGLLTALLLGPAAAAREPAPAPPPWALVAEAASTSPAVAASAPKPATARPGITAASATMLESPALPESPTRLWWRWGTRLLALAVGIACALGLLRLARGPRLQNKVSTAASKR